MERRWGEDGVLPSQKLSLQLKKQKHSRAEPPQPPAETRGKTLRQCVFLPSPRERELSSRFVGSS